MDLNSNFDNTGINTMGGILEPKESVTILNRTDGTLGIINYIGTDFLTKTFVSPFGYTGAGSGNVFKGAIAVVSDSSGGAITTIPQFNASGTRIQLDFLGSNISKTVNGKARTLNSLIKPSFISINSSGVIGSLQYQIEGSKDSRVWDIIGSYTGGLVTGANNIPLNSRSFYRYISIRLMSGATTVSLNGSNPYELYGRIKFYEFN
jgi:hypothetical protein